MFPDDYDPYAGILVEETPKMHEEDIHSLPGIKYHCYICGWMPKSQAEMQLLSLRVYERETPKRELMFPKITKPYKYTLSYCNNCLHYLKP